MVAMSDSVAGHVGPYKVTMGKMHRSCIFRDHHRPKSERDSAATRVRPKAFVASFYILETAGGGVFVGPRGRAHCCCGSKEHRNNA